MDSTKLRACKRSSGNISTTAVATTGRNIQSFECSQISGLHQGWNFCTSMPRPERQYFLAQEFELLLLGEAFFVLCQTQSLKKNVKKMNSPEISSAFMLHWKSIIFGVQPMSQWPFIIGAPPRCFTPCGRVSIDSDSVRPMGSKRWVNFVNDITMT